MGHLGDIGPHAWLAGPHAWLAGHEREKEREEIRIIRYSLNKFSFEFVYFFYNDIWHLILLLYLTFLYNNYFQL